jgi:hypothetical protein
MHFELGVSVTAVLEAKRFEIVIAFTQVHVISGQVAPDIARSVLSAVDSDEGPHTIVGVHAEVVRPGKVALERYADVKTNCG